MQVLPYVSAGAYGGYVGYRGYQRLKKWYNKPQSSSRRAYRGRSRYTRFKRVSPSFKKNYLAMKESKHLDSVYGGNLAPVSGTSVIKYIPAIAEGDSDGDRDGEDIYVTSLQCNYTVTSDADQTVDRTVYLKIVQQYDCRGVIMGITELYESDNPLAFRQLDNSKNFKILKSFKHIAPVKDTAGDQSQHQYSYYIKFKKPIRIKYKGVDVTNSSCDRNALYIVAMTNGTATDSPLIDFRTRLTFKDV